VKFKKLDKAVPFIYQPVFLLDKAEKYIFFKFPHTFSGKNVNLGACSVLKRFLNEKRGAGTLTPGSLQ
jgi:hypothetical protein